MARPPQVEDASSPRMQSAPINIAYGNQNDQRFWRDNYHHWSNHHQNQFDDSDHEEVEQNHHEDNNQDCFMMMHDGFSGGMVDSSDEVENVEECVSAVDDDVIRKMEQQTNDAITQQKVAEMSDDLFEQLLAENERKLRQLISYVENVHLVLK
ncbi:hypothetical protein GCK72_025687 [Caenorhabditis remanei]|uniref:Uncharacterized protein n=1 Tax=Caenorhabditis remanei TaxID=31234 RepID=A0A6A5G2Q5_CAERE|nr:hypothetical protein GCK72_025687 [Caenorhabditis remanei]KAF1749220.1 hypothetical protein GCK72_025687 [Caenorhabditis remanei]